MLSGTARNVLTAAGAFATVYASLSFAALKVRSGVRAALDAGFDRLQTHMTDQFDRLDQGLGEVGEMVKGLGAQITEVGVQISEIGVSLDNMHEETQKALKAILEKLDRADCILNCEPAKRGGDIAHRVASFTYLQSSKRRCKGLWD